MLGRAIPLIMLPIVTRMMPDSSYMGISDLSTTIVSFGSAFAIMGMYDAMYRLFFDKEDEQYRREVCSTAAGFTFFMALLTFCLMMIGKSLIAGMVFKDTAYTGVVIISAVAMFADATSGIIAAPTRMLNRRKVYVVTNAVAPLLSYTVAVYLLLKGCYVIALPMGMLLSKFTMGIPFLIMNKRWFKPSLFRKELLKPLLKIGVPVMPAILIYWVFHSCDRIMITNILGMSEAGVYAVGAKLGNFSQLIYVAFAGGWQYFAFATMKEKNQVLQNSLVFEYLGIISFAAVIMICTFAWPIFQVLFREEYLLGFVVAPYLFFSPLLQMLYQVIGNQFLIIKKTWYAPIVLSAGAVTNVILNGLLIPVFGIEGAAMGTLSGYLITLLFSAVLLQRKQLLVISKRFLIAVLAVTIFLVGWRLFLTTKVLVSFLLCVFCGMFFLYLYKKDIMRLAKQLNLPIYREGHTHD